MESKKYRKNKFTSSASIEKGDGGGNENAKQIYTLTPSRISESNKDNRIASKDTIAVT